MRHYVTLFDKNYLSRGLALYQSLCRNSSEDFRLWILPLDVETYLYLSDLQAHGHKKLEFLYLQDFDPIVQKLKNDRPWNYFCFGLAPEVICEVMEQTRDTVTYLDADSYFFQDPKLVFDEMGDKEVGIVSHNFPAHDYDRLIVNGMFNVSMVIVKDTGIGRSMMIAWRDTVRNKCDKDTCGDQLYLNEFPKILQEKLHIFDGIRIGAGPWNLYGYPTSEGPSVCGMPLIYMHYHEFRIKEDGYFLTGYPLTALNIKYVYEPYMKVIDFCEADIKNKTNKGFFKC